MNINESIMANQESIMTKKDVRRLVRQRIASMTPDQAMAESQQLCDRVAETEEWREACNVLMYMALPDEISLMPLVRRSLAEGKRVWMPVVDGDELRIRLYDERFMLPVPPFGIMEPTSASQELIAVDELDLALIPGRAFTRDGIRVGRGKGYYDRLLTRLTCPLWGVGYECQMFDCLPSDPWDVRMTCTIP